MPNLIEPRRRLWFQSRAGRVGVLAAGLVVALLWGALWGVLWEASGTVQGRFWLNRRGLEALAQAAAALPSIESLEIGDDGRLETGEPFDSYRFVNGTLVTHYPRQARPGSEQPILFVEDELRRLGVSRRQYDALRSLMAGSGIEFISRHPAEQQTDLIFRGRTNEWDMFLIYVPGAGNPGGRGLWDWGSLAPHWFWAMRA